MKCNYPRCDIEYSVSHHKYKCSVCQKYHCDNHACNTSYFRHLKGLQFHIIDKVINNKGYICKKCFVKYGPKDKSLVANIFDRVCNFNECNCDLKSVLTIKYSCVSCGGLSCNAHSIGIEKTTEEWQMEHLNYPLGEKVCLKCFNEKSAVSKIISYHKKALNLKFSAGDPNGDKRAIIVHGILSNPKQLGWFSRDLVKTGIINSVWLLDDLSYQGRVNEGKRIGINDIPLGLDVKKFGVSILKVLGNKIYQILDLPPYIVEGAARNLASTLKLLDWKGVTLIGHSLGGLVVRCAAETYELGDNVRNIITLGSPFQIWQKTYTPKFWKYIPNKKINYLIVLGKNDWVSTSRSFGNLTSNDEKLKNIVKVIIPGLDHTTIHKKANSVYLYEFLNSFLSGSLFNEKDKFFIRKGKKKVRACITELNGKPREEDHSFCFSGEWIEFEKI